MTTKPRGLCLVATLVLLSMLAVSVALAAIVRSSVNTENRRLLHDRTTEAGLLVGSGFSGFEDDLPVLATTTRPSVGDTAMFIASARPLLGEASTIAVLQVSGSAVTVVASVGAGPAAGSTLGGGLEVLARRARGAKGVASAVINNGHKRELTFAYAAPSGLVIDEILGYDLSSPYVASGGPFNHLDGALYASSTPDPATLVLSTTRDLPLTGAIDSQTVSIGADQWLIIAKSDGSLVGSLAANSPWGVLAAGVLATLLATLFVETLARRRRYALALVDERTQALTEALDEQARLEHRAHEAREVAERANRSKSEFLSRMSHELRTPLNAVLGFGQLLELDELDESQHEAVTQIIKGGRHLLALVNDVLDISRIETGNLAMSPEPVLVADLIAETVTLMRPMAAASHIELQASDDRSLGDVHVLADRQRVKQIMLNLVSNAIKYNRPDGTVTLAWTIEGNRSLRITVADTGYGIGPDDLERLFVPFERLGAERNDVEGTGVGLALSRHLAEAMGGTVDVTSVVGSGSTFWVQLPLVEGPLTRHDRLAGAGAVQPTTPGLDEARRHTVLYIEDNVANVLLIERVLERRDDIEIIPAMQGRLGLALAHEHRPTLILLDLHLPDIDGEEILRQLRSDPATASIPVVILSADATAGQVERLLAEGATAYLTKPLDVRQLLAVVAEAIDEASRVG